MRGGAHTTTHCPELDVGTAEGGARVLRRRSLRAQGIRVKSSARMGSGGRMGAAVPVRVAHGGAEGSPGVAGTTATPWKGRQGLPGNGEMAHSVLPGAGRRHIWHRGVGQKSDRQDGHVAGTGEQGRCMAAGTQRRYAWQKRLLGGRRRARRRRGARLPYASCRSSLTGTCPGGPRGRGARVSRRWYSIDRR